MSHHDFDYQDDNNFDCLFETCDDPECVFCQSDDGDAAFWDEFLSESEDEVVELSDDYSISLIDELSGEEVVLNNLNLKPFTVLKFN